MAELSANSLDGQMAHHKPVQEEGGSVTRRVDAGWIVCSREDDPGHPVCSVEGDNEPGAHDRAKQLQCPVVQLEHPDEEEARDCDRVVVSSRICRELDIEGRERVGGQQAEDELQRWNQARSGAAVHRRD